jgi:3-deoxy-D-manno-octulosonic-acid transferase
MTNPTAHLFTLLYSGTLEFGRLFVLPLAAKMKAVSGWDISERCHLPPCKKNTGDHTRVWIHAASLGESKLLAKFLNILRKKHPSFEYVLTAATRTGVDYLKGLDSEDIIAVGFFPLDTIVLMKKMLRVYRISRVWLMETELWPSMMLACMQTGIPVGIANARLEEKSFSSYRRLKMLYGPIFNHLDVVLAQNDTYAARFERLGVRPPALHVIGNLKAIVEIRPPSPKRRQTLRHSMKILEGDVVLTAGCIHLGEGKILREALDMLRASDVCLKCIVVPRHLDETATIIRELGPDTVRIDGIAAPIPWEICIIDKMGVLEDMYAIASIAFIGGTFVAVGGHNVWDAAQFGIPVLFGPDYHTQRESCERLLSAGVGFSVASAKNLSQQLMTTLKTDAAIFSAAFSTFTGLSRDHIARIESIIP